VKAITKLECWQLACQFPTGSPLGRSYPDRSSQTVLPADATDAEFLNAVRVLRQGYRPWKCNRASSNSGGDIAESKIMCGAGCPLGTPLQQNWCMQPVYLVLRQAYRPCKFTRASSNAGRDIKGSQSNIWGSGTLWGRR